MDSDSPHLVFVYGSLLAGESNHGYLRSASFEGPATVRGFALVDLGPYPAIVTAEAGARVHGEVYSVDATTLSALDELEEHPEVYRRERVRLADGRSVETYVLPHRLAAGHPRIPAGDWRRRGRSE